MAREPVRPIALELGGREVPLRVIRSARRRRTIAMGVNVGEVIVRAPMRMSQAEIVAFVRQRRAWVLKRLDAQAPSPVRRFEDGETVPYLGRELPLRVVAVPGRRSSVVLEPGGFAVQVPWSFEGEARAAKVRAGLTAWYRERANSLFAELVTRWSAASGLTPKSVLVRDQKSRWGSCGPDGTIRFNWRLVLAQPELAEYVVVHELAHLRHKHHQAAFWEEVARMLPDHRERRKRLRLAGPGLAV